ncbi:hypothetical protein [Plantibacter sp. M259]|uniref:hypothetical protein n=1 Tax=Plantibacter sp. M259 TaxID=2583822 RepID=UPI00111094B9|nr:hypothetical protein [Plantibacter sp. M259]
MSVSVPLDIDILLRAQRGALRIVPATPTKSHHHASYVALKRILANFGLEGAPELVLVDSTHALTEMIKAGPRQWIVYDLHLARIFERLGAVVDAEATLREIDADLTRIYVGRLLVHGRARPAFVVSICHLNGMMDDLIEVDPSHPAHKVRIRAQEVFVLAHELMHHVFAAHPALATTLTEMYFSLCEAEESDADKRVVPSAREMAESLAEDVNREWTRRHGGLDEADLNAGKQLLVERYLAQIADSRPHTSKTARANPVLSEEVVCDAGAAVLTAMLLGDQHPEKTLDALVAAFDANQKLRLIAHMDAHIVGADRTPQGLIDATTRGSQLRQFYRALFESGLTKTFFGFETTPASYEAMLEQIRTINERFYTTLFDQLITGTFYAQLEQFEDADAPLQKVAPESLVTCWSVASAFASSDL